MTDSPKAHAAPAADAFSRAPFRKGGLMLADGTFFEGTGFGAVGSAIGEVCFNTAMTGYQEILSDPSYAEHPSNYRNLLALDGWLKKHNIPAVAGIDTRALTAMIREKGMPHGVVVNLCDGGLDRDALVAQAK